MILRHFCSAFNNHQTQNCELHDSVTLVFRMALPLKSKWKSFHTETQPQNFWILQTLKFCIIFITDLKINHFENHLGEKKLKKKLFHGSGHIRIK